VFAARKLPRNGLVGGLSLGVLGKWLAGPKVEPQGDKMSEPATITEFIIPPEGRETASEDGAVLLDITEKTT
jgi:hypothetical protein